MANQIDFKVFLKEKGYKFTTQRRVILNVLIDNAGKHLTCEDVYEIVKETNPEIGIATVYRTLLLFDRLDIIYKIDLDDSRNRYEVNLYHDNHINHNLICTKCGKIQTLDNEIIEKLRKELKRKYDFEVKNNKIKIYGYCKECKEKE